MLWNVCGWLVTGVILNHAHHESEKSFCDISFCYCATDEGETVCTCHHHDINGNSEHQSGDHVNSGICYFTNNHTSNTTASEFVFTNNLTAYYFPKPTTFYRTTTTYLPAEPISNLLDGSFPDLLRPPQV